MIQKYFYGKGRRVSTQKIVFDDAAQHADSFVEGWRCRDDRRHYYQ